MYKRRSSAPSSQHERGLIDAWRPHHRLLGEVGKALRDRPEADAVANDPRSGEVTGSLNF